MKFGYMRVSTLDQNLDRQKKQLEGVPPHIHQLNVYFYTKCGLST